MLVASSMHERIQEFEHQPYVTHTAQHGMEKVCKEINQKQLSEIMHLHNTNNNWNKVEIKSVHLYGKPNMSAFLFYSRSTSWLVIAWTKQQLRWRQIRWSISSCHHKIANAGTGQDFDIQMQGIMSISTVLADGLAPSGDKSSAGNKVIKIIMAYMPIYTTPSALNHQFACMENCKKISMLWQFDKLVSMTMFCFPEYVWIGIFQ